MRTVHYYLSLPFVPVVYLTLSGCNPTEVHEHGVMTRAELVEQLSAAYCKAIERCCGSYGSMATAKGCRSYFNGGFFAKGTITEQRPATELVADASAAASCVAQIEAMACAAPSDRQLWDATGAGFTSEAEAACRFLSGDVAVGGSCGKGVYCDPQGTCVDGTCVARVKTGESCCVGSTCDDTLCSDFDYCAFDGDKRCHNRTPAGSPCSDDRTCLSFHCAKSEGVCRPVTFVESCPAEVGSYVTVTGAVDGQTPLFWDIRFESDTVCGPSGLYLGISGSSLSPCSAPLSSNLKKPYLQIRTSQASPGTYFHGGDSCRSAPAGSQAFYATLDRDGSSTLDSMSGSVTIDAADGSMVFGSFEIAFGGPTSDGILKGSFAARACTN